MVSTVTKLNTILLLDTACFTLIIVAFLPHIEKLGASQIFNGSIASTMSFIGLMWNPIVGSLGDTYGRKFILVRMLAIGTISHLLLAFSESLTLIFIARTISAFGGPLIPVLNATAGEMLNEEEKSKYFSRFPAITSVSFICGSFFAGFLVELPNGYKYCYSVMAILALINIGIASSFPDKKLKKQQKPESKSLLTLAKDELVNVFMKLTQVNWSLYSDLFSSKLFIEFSASLIINSIGPSMKFFQVTGRSIAYIFTIFSASTIASNILLLKLKATLYADDKYGKKRMFHSMILFVISVCVLWYSETIYVYAFGLVPFAIAKAIADSTLTEVLMAKASDEDRGRVSGAFESIVSFSGLITPLLAGILTDSYGLKATLQLTFIPVITGLVFSCRN